MAKTKTTKFEIGQYLLNKDLSKRYYFDVHLHPSKKFEIVYEIHNIHDDGTLDLLNLKSWELTENNNPENFIPRPKKGE